MPGERRGCRGRAVVHDGCDGGGDAGIDVLPYRWRDESAVAYASSTTPRWLSDASKRATDGMSLSPVTIRQARGSAAGTAVAQRLDDLPATQRERIHVRRVSLRNAAAAAEWVASSWQRTRADCSGDRGRGAVERTARSVRRSRTSGVRVRSWPLWPTVVPGRSPRRHERPQRCTGMSRRNCRPAPRLRGWARVDAVRIPGGCGDRRGGEQQSPVPILQGGVLSR